MERFSKTMELGENGRVVIPKEIRQTLGVEKGDEVMFIAENGEVKLTTRAALVKKLSGSFASDDKRDLTQELLDERRKEAGRKGW
jgi:AbrB family transcriptional regulator, stage V sporulation protein T